MIYVNAPRLEGRERQYVDECLETGWISSSGRFLESFEASWAKYCGREYGIAVSSGTAALEIAVRCLDLEPGDEVILPAFTIVSCAMAVVACSAVPVFVDCDPDTWCMDVDHVRAAITPRTKAIMPVHIYGHPVDMEALGALADDAGIAIVEDSAEAHGAECRVMGKGTQAQWARCGSFGIASCFSFYANKIVTTGEGGMVVTDDASVADHARSLRNLCFRADRRFFHTELGYNYRMTNLQAAIGLAQVENIESALEHKRWLAHAYTARLGETNCLQLPVERDWAHSVFWMYGVVLDEEAGMSAEEFSAALGLLGVETRPFFLGLHEQPALRGISRMQGAALPVTERLSRQGVYLPSGLSLTEDELCEVVNAVDVVLSGRR